MPDQKDLAEAVAKADVALIETEAEAIKHEGKPLRHARSQAELTRVKQGWALITLSSINLMIALLILAHQLGIL